MAQALALSVGVLLTTAIVGVVLAFAAATRLDSRRTTLVDGLAPALTASLALENALVSQQTGVRGYALTGEPRFLEPYRDGRAMEQRAYRDLAALEDAAGAELTASVEEIRETARRWRSGYAEGVIAQPPGDPAPALAGSAQTGKTLFDPIRVSLRTFQADIEARREDARGGLLDAASLLKLALILAGVAIVAAVLGAAVLLRRFVTSPLARLGRQARLVASGEFQTPLMPSGPREIAAVGRDLEAMRERIAAALATSDAARATIVAQADELARSNADLEQFAYVASHDLQEPLRKVASFCQVLERRYRGQLDERADQYIDFIVDGAKRMQVLINDLLAFSRVGRRAKGLEPLDANELVEQARSSLALALTEGEARLEVGELPVVRGERALLVAVFQNLIANAVKFRGELPAVVRIDARRDDGLWEFCCQDNGIGIEPEFAERIFSIFQRLHPRDAYPGTGIGLAMCRRIVEFHGGRIWLDTDHTVGSCFRFTLPVAEEER